MSPDEVGRVMGSLDWNLDVLARLNRSQRAEESDHSLTTRMGINRAVVERLRPHAKHYDPHSVIRRSELLVAIDRAAGTYGRGRAYPLGTLQVMAARW